MKTTENETIILYSEKKYIRNRTRKLAGEHIDFLGGKRLGDVRNLPSTFSARAEKSIS